MTLSVYSLFTENILRDQAIDVTVRFMQEFLAAVAVMVVLPVYGLFFTLFYLSKSSN